MKRLCLVVLLFGVGVGCGSVPKDPAVESTRPLASGPEQVPVADPRPRSYVVNYVDGSHKICVVTPLYNLDGTFAYMHEQCY